MLCHASEAPCGFEPCQGFQRRLGALVRSCLFASIDRPQFTKGVQISRHIAFQESPKFKVISAWHELCVTIRELARAGDRSLPV
jgi:hypothetical protein